MLDLETTVCDLEDWIGFLEGSITPNPSNCIWRLDNTRDEYTYLIAAIEHLKSLGISEVNSDLLKDMFDASRIETRTRIGTMMRHLGFSNRPYGGQRWFDLNEVLLDHLEYNASHEDNLAR